jgi:cytidylate kinase
MFATTCRRRSNSFGLMLLFYFLADSKPRRIVVAIDGPAGAGKSTLATRVAARLGFTYIDTGAMYRAVALWALRQNVSWEDMHRMEQLAIAAEIELSPGRIQLNGEDVTEAIRTPEVSSGASQVAVIPGVRRAMVAKQRAMGERTSVVMEGRDIGTVVFPNADVKIFLDADPAERVRRRLRESRAKGEEVSEGSVAAQMKERDQRDSTRSDAPLAQAPDAAYLDSTPLSLDEAEEAVLKIVRSRVTNGKDFS